MQLLKTENTDHKNMWKKCEISPQDGISIALFLPVPTITRILIFPICLSL